MPLPPVGSRELLLLQNLQTTIRSISIGTGYTWDVKASSVVLDSVNIFDISDLGLPFFIVEPSDEGNRTFEPAMQLDDVFVAVITARVDAKGLDPDRRTSIGLTLAANLEKVMAVDVERGGLATDTRLRKAAIFTSMSGDQPVILVQRVELKVHRTFGEPA